MDRRTFLTTTAAFAALAPMARAATTGETVSFSEAEWRRRLTAEEYGVMREMGTERAFSSPLNKLETNGTYHCKGCDQALYSSKTKFESGTGWPSFWAPLDGAVGTKPDRGFFTTRTEVHCARCKSHMGHVFDDGPQPTGKRYCMNGVAMRFHPAGSGEVVSG